MKRRAIAAFNIGVLLVVLFATARMAAQADLPSLASESSPKLPYLLQPGDVLEIKFFFTPELNQTVPIRPDGKISLQLVDQLQAADATPTELSKALAERYSAYLRTPEVAVIVREFGGRVVYVGGEVAAPNVMSLKSTMTVLQAIFAAGGFRESAQPGSVIVISKGKEGLPHARKLNLKKAMSGADPTADSVVQPFDIIFVPKSTIGKVNKFVDQYINNIIPRSVVFGGFSYVLYHGTQTTTVPITPH